ncbi:YdcF family protein [Pelosinus propionicus]|uniref:Protein SanA, affects membrane permeability for vancomycin n=1 Tax=Pelosinus propionicus DSM 13327 TaxID=1123291 RepID=A0A1I4MVM8_9FIRM|nr:YdcF family protein [Pelosinus propionicus]SFM07372.1 protein SanA, affects membrane permeability for vancomycin [Pelosinus propionicus DSM 13327]
MNFSKKLRTYMLYIILLLILVIEIPIIAIGYLTQPVKSDTIIVLGAKILGQDPSLMLRLRLDEAIRLYNAGYAPAIIVSGAQGPDESISEAASMRSYLLTHGIPEEHIFLEDQSFNTYQNLTNSHKIMQINNFKTAVIVSNASHMRRSLLLAQNLGIQVTGSPAPMASSPYLTAKQYVREGAAIAVLFFTGN